MRAAAARTAIAWVAAALLAAGCASADGGRVEEPAPPPPVARVRVHPVADLVVPWPDRISAIQGNCVLYLVDPPPGVARRYAESVRDRELLLKALREACSVPDGGTSLLDGDFLVVRGDPALQESVASWLERRRAAAQ